MLNHRSRDDAADAFLNANTQHSDKTIRHGYHEAYGPLLLPYLNAPAHVLEIGIQNGESLEMWRRMFPQLLLTVGIGYGPGRAVEGGFKHDHGGGVVTYYGDQSDPVFLSRLIKDLNGTQFDVIIDDGSHVPWHNIFTLELLFDEVLAPGGLYVIEDMETSYWDGPKANLYGMYDIHAGPGTHGSAIEKLKYIPDVLNRKFLNDPSFSVLRGGIDHMVASITFGRNCVALVKKDPARWDKLDATLDAPMPYQSSRNVRTYGARLNPNRTSYRAFKAAANWQVTGTPEIDSPAKAERAAAEIAT